MITLVKVKDDQVAKYPYTEVSLREENPFTAFFSPDVAANFEGTDAWLAGYRLQPVIEILPPAYNGATQVAVQDTVPTLQDGTWLLGWTVRDKTPDEVAAYKRDRKIEIMTLRDRRTDGGLTFNGWPFQTRPEDRENVAGASQIAALWLMNGGDANTLRWADPDNDFVWIDANNDLRPMSASMMIGFGRELATLKSACIFHAHALKQAIDAATTAAEVAAVDIYAGWPS